VFAPEAVNNILSPVQIGNDDAAETKIVGDALTVN
jgi:hypothetical protein